MAEKENKPLEEEDDNTPKKKAKKPKKEKKSKKEKKKKNGKEKVEDEEESGGGKLLIFFVTIIIIAVWLTILALLVKWDVGGFGSTVLYPILKDVPYVNKILPEVKETTTKTDSEGQQYSSIDEAVAQIKELELEIQKLQDAKDKNSDYVTELENEVARLQVYEQEQADFEKTKKEFYQEVVFSDQAPDIDEYKKYYESIDAANAEILYKQVVQQEQSDEKVTEYAKTYASMKPKQAAGIMEAMTDNLNLVAEILQNMDADSRAAILGAMDAKVAASVTKLMAP